MPEMENSENLQKSLENADPQQSSLGSIGNLEAALAVIGQLKWDLNGLIPAIVQDASTQQVLMMAYMNAESLRRTLEIGETVFWSRSRSELWHKGATSGNTQKVRDLRIDCDGDTLLILVEPEGPACHTGEVSCFYRTLSEFEAK